MDLPETVTLEIVEADPVVKGQTASSSYKPALLSNGVKVMVPPFITAGEKIVVKTADGYLLRTGEVSPSTPRQALGSCKSGPWLSRGPVYFGFRRLPWPARHPGPR